MVTSSFKQTSANLLVETKVRMFELGKTSFSRFPRSFKFKKLKNADRAVARETGKMFELVKILFSRFSRNFKLKNLKNADRAGAREIDNMFELARISFKRFVRNFKFENLKISSLRKRV